MYTFSQHSVLRSFFKQSRETPYCNIVVFVPFYYYFLYFIAFITYYISIHLFITYYISFITYYIVIHYLFPLNFPPKPFTPSSTLLFHFPLTSPLIELLPSSTNNLRTEKRLMLTSYIFEINISNPRLHSQIHINLYWNLNFKLNCLLLIDFFFFFLKLRSF